MAGMGEVRGWTATHQWHGAPRPTRKRSAGANGLAMPWRPRAPWRSSSPIIAKPVDARPDAAGRLLPKDGGISIRSRGRGEADRCGAADAGSAIRPLLVEKGAQPAKLRHQLFRALDFRLGLAEDLFHLRDLPIARRKEILDAHIQKGIGHASALRRGPADYQSTAAGTGSSRVPPQPPDRACLSLAPSSDAFGPGSSARGSPGPGCALQRRRRDWRSAAASAHK